MNFRVNFYLVLETDPLHKLRFTLKTENYDQNPDEEGNTFLDLD